MTGRVAPAVRALAVVSLANDVASEMVYPLLPALVVGGMGGGPIALGVLDGASEVAASVLRWWSGRAADRRSGRGRGILIGLGYLIATVARPLSAVAQWAWQVVGIRIVDRIGKGLRSPARDAMIADLTEPTLLGRAFGIQRSADHLGAVLGSLVAFELVRRGWSVREVIGASVVPGVAAILALGIALALARGARHFAAPPADTEPRSGPDSRATGRLGWLALLTAARLPETLLLLRLQELGAPVATIPLVWALLHVVRSVTAYPAGIAADRLGVRPALAIGGLANAVALFAMGASDRPGLAIALFLSLGIVGGVLEPAERAAVARLVPDRRGSAYGRFQALAGVGTLLSGLGFGAIYQAVGAPWAFSAAAALGLAVLIGWRASERGVVG